MILKDTHDQHNGVASICICQLQIGFSVFNCGVNYKFANKKNLEMFSHTTQTPWALMLSHLRRRPAEAASNNQFLPSKVQIFFWLFANFKIIKLHNFIKRVECELWSLKELLNIKIILISHECALFTYLLCDSLEQIRPGHF